LALISQNPLAVMRYLNPFILLGINPNDFRADDDRLRKERKRCLAEVELDGALGGIEIDRAEFLEVMAGLDDSVWRSAHEKIFGNPGLHAFLQNGDEGLFRNLGQKILDEFDSREVEKISPFLADRAAKALRNHLENHRYLSARKIAVCVDVLSETHREVLLRPVKAHFRTKIDRIIENTAKAKDNDDIRYILSTRIQLTDSCRYYNPFSLSRRFRRPETFLSSYLGENEARLLNELGADLSLIRTGLADAMSNLSVAFHNKFSEYELAWLLDVRAKMLEQGVASKEHIGSNSQISFRAFVSQQFDECHDLLLKLQKDVSSKYFQFPESVADNLILVFDIEFLNLHASSQTDVKVIGLVNLSIGIAKEVLETYKAKGDALRIISHLSSIRLFDPEVRGEVLQKISAAYAEIERWAPPQIPRANPNPRRSANATANTTANRATNTTATVGTSSRASAGRQSNQNNSTTSRPAASGRASSNQQSTRKTDWVDIVAEFFGQGPPVQRRNSEPETTPKRLLIIVGVTVGISFLLIGLYLLASLPFKSSSKNRRASVSIENVGTGLPVSTPFPLPTPEIAATPEAVDLYKPEEIKIASQEWGSSGYWVGYGSFTFQNRLDAPIMLKIDSLESERWKKIFVASNSDFVLGNVPEGRYIISLRRGQILDGDTPAAPGSYELWRSRPYTIIQDYDSWTRTYSGTSFTFMIDGRMEHFTRVY